MKQSGWGIASLVCGIAGILLACVAIGVVPAIIGLVCAIIALTQKWKGHGTAIAGLICSIVAIIIFIFASLIFDGNDSDQPKKYHQMKKRKFKTRKTIRQKLQQKKRLMNLLRLEILLRRKI